jgi:hypothetical protein
MKHYSPPGRRKYGRPLKRFPDTWNRKGSTSGPTAWQIYDDNDDDHDDDHDDDDVCTSVRPFAWKQWAPTEWIFMEFRYLRIFQQPDEKIQGSIKSNKNNRHFTRRPVYILDHILLISSLNEKCFRPKL